MADVRMVSTALVPEKERFAFWREAIQTREQLTKSRFTLRHGSTFHGSLEYGDLGPLQICKLTASITGLGAIAPTTNDPRVMQFALKYKF